LPLIQAAAVPLGPVHVLIDGLQVYRAVNGRKRNMASNRAENGASCI
jgi:hypothetical protein